MGKEFNHGRIVTLREIFKRSASRWQVLPGRDPLTENPNLSNSQFFSEVRGGRYFIETALGGWGEPEGRGLFLVADGANADRIPNIMVQLKADGSLIAVIEQTVTRSGEGDYTPISARPLFPGLTPDDEILAEEVADIVINHLRTRGEELGLGIRPACLR